MTNRNRNVSTFRDGGAIETVVLCNSRSIAHASKITSKQCWCVAGSGQRIMRTIRSMKISIFSWRFINSALSIGVRGQAAVCVCVDAPFIYSPGGGSALETRDFLHIYTHRTIQTYSLSVLLNPRSPAIACHRYLWIIYALTHKVAIDKLPKWRLGL